MPEPLSIPNNCQIGGHVSISGGIDQAVQRAVNIGGNCMQVFSGSPRSWQRPEVDQKSLKKMFAIKQELGFKSIFTHTLYLINLASEKQALVTKSIRSLIFDLQFDSLVKGSGAIVHLGSHQGRGFTAVRTQLVKTLQDILQHTPPDSKLLIENSAGQQGKIASELTEIKWLLDELHSNRVGWCVDTCHAFAAGYPLVASSDYCQTSVKKDLVTTIKELQLAESLSCIHVNDSKTPFNGSNDRHENIGQGLIPSADLQNFLRHDLIKGIPIITEVPGMDGTGPDQANITKIKKLVGV